MEIFFTILAGTCTFVGGQIVLKLIVEPVHAMKSTIAEISHKLILYANIYANPKAPGEDKQDDALKDFRSLSSKLQSVMYLVPMYRLTSKVFGLPSRKIFWKHHKI